jgi:hypothetical protein
MNSWVGVKIKYPILLNSLIVYHAPEQPFDPRAFWIKIYIRQLGRY